MFLYIALGMVVLLPAIDSLFHSLLQIHDHGVDRTEIPSLQFYPYSQPITITNLLSADRFHTLAWVTAQRESAGSCFFYCLPFGDTASCSLVFLLCFLSWFCDLSVYTGAF
jgi:hypothetical protein